jgi:hypothetical protein
MKRSGPRGAATLSESIHHQLDMYALAATAAGVGILALVQPAEAKIVYTPANKNIPYCDWNDKCFKLDLNHDGIADFRIPFVVHGSYSNLSVLPVSHRNRIWGYTSKQGRGLASALSSGVSVGANAVKFKIDHYAMWGRFLRRATGTGSSWWGQWYGVQNKYLGLKFYIKGKVHYGWARLNFNGISAKLTGYAYETVGNKSIVTGKTKGPDVITVQPASLGHLAAGASAIPAWRTTGGNQ